MCDLTAARRMLEKGSQALHTPSCLELYEESFVEVSGKAEVKEDDG
jgi:hypothetical protein